MLHSSNTIVPMVDEAAPLKDKIWPFGQLNNQDSLNNTHICAKLEIG